jgi:hypothetical protein
MTIKKELHYGKEVFVNTEMDALRKTECLCLSCTKMSDCHIAKDGYRLCKDNNI